MRFRERQARREHRRVATGVMLLVPATFLSALAVVLALYPYVWAALAAKEAPSPRPSGYAAASIVPALFGALCCFLSWIQAGQRMAKLWLAVCTLVFLGSSVALLYHGDDPVLMHFAKAGFVFAVGSTCALFMKAPAREEDGSTPVPPRGTGPASLCLGLVPAALLLVLLSVRGHFWVLPVFAVIGVAALVASRVVSRRTAKAVDAPAAPGEPVRLRVNGPLLNGVAVTSLLLALLWCIVLLPGKEDPLPPTDSSGHGAVGLQKSRSAPAASQGKGEEVSGTKP